MLYGQRLVDLWFYQTKYPTNDFGIINYHRWSSTGYFQIEFPVKTNGNRLSFLNGSHNQDQQNTRSPKRIASK